MKRHILRERNSSHIFFQEPEGVPTLAYPCKLVRDDLISCVSHARLWFSALCLNLTAWFSSRGLLLVTHQLYPSALIVLSCLLITTWQFVKTHRVTRNEQKIHGIRYITTSKILCKYIFQFKKHHGALWSFSEETKNITKPPFWSVNPGHKPCDPGHSKNACTWISYVQRSSHSIHRILPKVTGELRKIQK